MKKILIINNSDGGLYGFRGPIIKRLVRDDYQVVTISPNENGCIPKVQELGAKTYEVDFHGHSTGFISALKMIYYIYTIIKKEQPDIVHSFTHKANIFGSFAAKFAGVSNIIATVTGLGTLFTNDRLKTKTFRKILIYQYKFIGLFVQHIIFQNPDDMQVFEDNKIASKNKFVLVNGSGLDLEKYPIVTEAENKTMRKILINELGFEIENKIIVLYPARAVKDKGFFEFYEASKLISRLTDKYIFVHLGLVDKHSSNGISLDNILDYAKENSVHYLGYKTNIREYMMASDIITLPSYREGTPMSLIEALSLNKMIITTDAPGCREVVIDGWNGLYCKVADVNSLVSTIMCSDKIIDNLEDNPRLLCEKKYDVNIQYDILQNLYLKKERKE